MMKNYEILRFFNKFSNKIYLVFVLEMTKIEVGYWKLFCSSIYILRKIITFKL